MLDKIRTKIECCDRISRSEAEWLLVNAGDEELAELAVSVKNRHHVPNTAQFLIMAIINYTNICVAGCDYCAFYRYPHDTDAYLRDFDALRPSIERAKSLGGTLIALNGGFHPKLHLKDYAKLFGLLHAEYPQQTFFEMTVAEFLFACRVSKLSLAQGAKLLKDAGTCWITGGGAEILDNSFRKRHSPGKFRVEEYLAAQRAVLKAGIGSTATMVVGFDESIAERFNHLETLRDFQDSLDGNKLVSFLCWTYKPHNTKFGGLELSSAEYLRWLGICRIYLDNFTHIRTSVLTQNEGALAGLRYGADDFDLPIEDEVTQKAGATISLDFEHLLNCAREQGLKISHRKPFVVGENSGLLPHSRACGHAS